MQLSALEDKKLIFAYKAVKQKDYQCLECGKALRVRGGNHRQAHFFHTEPDRKCRQHSKGLPHLMVQYYLKDLLPEGEGEMECRFSKIGRIADVAWHKEKIIFEIQYSPISAEEIRARNLSYQSIGYQVIWILHDHRYNQFILTEAEDALLKQPHYFTNMNELGQGMIYDQFSKIKKAARIYRLPKLAIDLKTPYKIDQDPICNIQKNKKIAVDRKLWNLGFHGDVLNYLTNIQKQQKASLSEFDLRFLNLVEDIPESNESYHLTFQFIKILWQRWIVAPYKAIFRALLERACS